MTIPYICKGTLERILGVKIERIVYIKTQESFNADYVHTGIPTDNFVKSIDREVESARINRKWREEYMKFRLCLQEAQEAGERIKEISLIRHNHREGYSAEAFAPFLMLDTDYVNSVIHLIDNHPDWDDDQIYEALRNSNS